MLVLLFVSPSRSVKSLNAQFSYQLKFCNKLISVNTEIAYCMLPLTNAVSATVFAPQKCALVNVGINKNTAVAVDKYPRTAFKFFILFNAA